MLIGDVFLLLAFLSFSLKTAVCHEAGRLRGVQDMEDEHMSKEHSIELIWASQDSTVLERASKCVEAPPGLLLHHWSGDKDGLDETGNNHGTLELGATAGESGIVNGSFHFPGRVALDETVTLEEDFTVMAWWNTPGAGRYTLVGYGNVTNPRHYIQIRNKVRYKYKINDMEWSSVMDGGYETDMWYHVALTRKKGVMKIYHNGTEIISPRPPPLMKSPFHINNIGRCDDGWNGMLGYIDEVKVLKEALGPNMIRIIYETGASGMCA